MKDFSTHAGIQMVALAALQESSIDKATSEEKNGIQRCF
jgi:hypothetical protein